MNESQNCLNTNDVKFPDYLFLSTFLELLTFQVYLARRKVKQVIITM